MLNASHLDHQFIKSEMLKLYFIPGWGLCLFFKCLHVVPIFSSLDLHLKVAVYANKFNSYQFLQSQAGVNSVNHTYSQSTVSPVSCRLQFHTVDTNHPLEDAFIKLFLGLILEKHLCARTNSPSFYRFHKLYAQALAACAIYWCAGLGSHSSPASHTAADRRSYSNRETTSEYRGNTIHFHRSNLNTAAP